MNSSVILFEIMVMLIGMILISLLTFSSDYLPEIQAKHCNTQHKESIKEKLTWLLIIKKLIAVVAFLFMFAWMLHLDGLKTFWQGVGLAWLYMFYVFAWNTFFLEWVLFVNIKRFRLPGTEHMDK